MQPLRLKTPDDIARIREAGRVIAEIFALLSAEQLQGRSTWEIDRIIQDFIHKKKARPSFTTVRNYAHASCISINNEVVHGVPSRKKIIRKGDIVKVDIGVVKNGYFADRCDTFMVQPVSEAARRLVGVAGECLASAIAVTKAGKRLGDIGHAVQSLAEARGFSVVRDLTGHGVGFAAHELPTVLHYGVENTGSRLYAGMVLAIEPMVNEGGGEVLGLDDGWTIVTADGLLSAQFEHTVAVTERGPQVLTA
jgi:methionyl aminopeptidase